MSSCLCLREINTFLKEKENQTSFSIKTEIPKQPKNPYYNIIPSVENDQISNNLISKKVKFTLKNLPENENIFPWVKNEAFSLKNSQEDSDLIVLRIVNIFKKKENKQMTIIYSHENEVDLGLVYSFMVDLSLQMKVKKLN